MRRIDAVADAPWNTPVPWTPDDLVVVRGHGLWAPAACGGTTGRWHWDADGVWCASTGWDLPIMLVWTATVPGLLAEKHWIYDPTAFATAVYLARSSTGPQSYGDLDQHTLREASTDPVGSAALPVPLRNGAAAYLLNRMDHPTLDAFNTWRRTIHPLPTGMVAVAAVADPAPAHHWRHRPRRPWAVEPQRVVE